MPTLSSDRRPVRRPNFLLIAAVVFVACLYLLYAVANLMLVLGRQHDPAVLIGTQLLPQRDFGLFWCAGNELATQAATRFGIPAAQAYREICRNNLLSTSAPPSEAWPYPPTMGFLVVPFAMLPLAAAFWVWRAVCVLVAAWLLRRGGLGWPVILLGLASPAAWHDFLGGQNGTLTGGVLVACLLLAERRPRTAGILAGLLTMKPHLGVPVVIAIIRLRAVRMAASAAIVAAAMIGLSLLVWGEAGWRWFFGVAQHDEWLMASLPFSQAFQGAGITVYLMVRSAGGSQSMAMLIQGAAALGAALLLWAIWKPGRMAEQPRAACSLCLGVLIVPHGFMYDLVGYSIAMAMLMVALSGWARFAAALLWLLAGYTGIISIYTRILDFPVLALLSAAFVWQVRHAPAWQQKTHPSRRARPIGLDESGCRLPG